MLTTTDLFRMKDEKEKIVMLTAYDYPSAKQAEEAGADIILVGDSLGNVVLGYTSTTQVTLDDMIHHGKAARRGAKNTFMTIDMPFFSYHASMEQAIENARKLFQETNAQSVKIEGASEENLSLTRRLTDGGIPVIGHLGLTPQTVNVLGGYRVQGRDEETSKKLFDDAKKLAQAGAIAIVLECVPKELAELITASITIPTIGIGAGAECDGQVLVYHDILQYGVGRLPKFVKTYANFNKYGVQALQNYVTEVKNGQFPTVEYTYTMDKALLPKE